MSLKDKIILYKYLEQLDIEVTQMFTTDDTNELGIATSLAKSIINIENYLRKEMP